MNAVVNRYPCSSSWGVIVLHHNSRIRDRATREADGHPNVKTAVQLCQSTHSGPHGQNRASFLMNPMYSIARTRQCPRKSCSPRQPMAAYMWNGLQPVTSFTLIPNPNGCSVEGREPWPRLATGCVLTASTWKEGYLTLTG